MTSTEPSVNETHPTTRRLESLLGSRQQIAAAVADSARELSGAARSRSLALSRWFQKPVTAEAVLSRPDALCVCLPLISEEVSHPPEAWQIEDAVRRGLDSAYWKAPVGRSAFSILAYPLIVAILFMVLLIAFCLFLIPEFEKMFDDFGLALPFITELIISLSHFIQSWGMILLSLLLVGLIALPIATKLMGRNEPTRQGWLTSKRWTLACWVWHVALLIDARFSRGEAIRTAGRSSRKADLQRASFALAEQLESEQHPFDKRMQLMGQRCHLLTHAMQMTQMDDQSGFLREVASMYWDRDRNRTRWLLAWLSPALICLVGVFAGLVVAAMFMPLLDLIQGLT